MLVKSQHMQTVVQCASSQEALDLLQYCLGEDGDVIPGRHFREELRNEGLDMEDAFAVLRTGMIYDPPEPDIKTGEWKWRVEGKCPDGQYIGIVFSFKTVERAFLITVFSIERQRRGGKK